jgi:hypothetical protein
MKEEWNKNIPGVMVCAASPINTTLFTGGSSGMRESHHVYEYKDI